jgi:hypothetical protein
MELDSSFVKVHDTEGIQSVNPRWRAMDLSLQHLCNGDHQRVMKFVVNSRNGSTDTLIGECRFTINEIVTQGKTNFTLTGARGGQSTGAITIVRQQLVTRPTFLDYLRGGVKIDTILAVDFTGSNGNPTHHESLHAIKPGHRNQYQKAIDGVMDVLLHYDSTEMVAMFGFGAELRYPTMRTNSVLHCFPMTANLGNPYACGLNQIEAVYQNTLLHVHLSGPTYFSPLLTETIKLVQERKNKGSMEYTILVIMTDGDINDMQETKDRVVECSLLPISIVIVGIGHHTDFVEMETLEGDFGNLRHSNGTYSQRNAVQFVSFVRFKHDHEALSRAVLEKIPDQVTAYYRLAGIQPLQPTVVNLNDMNLSLAGLNTIAYQQRGQGVGNVQGMTMTQPNMMVNQMSTGMVQPNMMMNQQNMGMNQQNMGMNQPNMGMNQMTMNQQNMGSNQMQPNMTMNQMQYGGNQMTMNQQNVGMNLLKTGVTQMLNVQNNQMQPNQGFNQFGGNQMMMNQQTMGTNQMQPNVGMNQYGINQIMMNQQNNQIPQQNMGMNQQVPQQTMGMNQQVPQQTIQQVPQQTMGMNQQVPQQNMGMNQQVPQQTMGMNQQVPQQNMGMNQMQNGCNQMMMNQPNMAGNQMSTGITQQNMGTNQMVVNTGMIQGNMQNMGTGNQNNIPYTGSGVSANFASMMPSPQEQQAYQAVSPDNNVTQNNQSPVQPFQDNNVVVNQNQITQIPQSNDNSFQTVSTNAPIDPSKAQDLNQNPTGTDPSNSGNSVDV